MESHFIIREIKEIRQQLSYSKNVGFFFGAGTSAALGIPNITQLTEEIHSKLEEKSKGNYEKVINEVGSNSNVENVLNYLRLIRELTKEKEDKSHLELSGKAAKDLDTEICELIYDIIKEKEDLSDLSTTKTLIAWMNLLNRDYSKEIFTTNYDLILEKSIEACAIPYFDGFIGSYEPFFFPESFESGNKDDWPPTNWIRLWKLHGSLNWFWKHSDGLNTIIRQARNSVKEDSLNELVIYPSKDKYNASRKQPFIAYFDRLKAFLQSGELLMIISGYSFSDDHINEIFFSSLRNNIRLTIMVFCFSDETVELLESKAATYLNLLVFGPTKAIIKGSIAIWEKEEDSELDTSQYWNDKNKIFKLGDFKHLVQFIAKISPNLETSV